MNKMEWKQKKQEMRAKEIADRNESKQHRDERK